MLPWITDPPPLADMIFTLHEDAEPTRRACARVVAPLRALPHDGWQRFEFRPIPNSRGRSYRMTIEAPTTIDVGRVALALQDRRTRQEPTPALAVHYLVKGVVDALPLDDESFLFLHNTTVSDALVPGVGMLAATGDDFASSLLPPDPPAEPPSGEPPAEPTPVATAGHPPTRSAPTSPASPPSSPSRAARCRRSPAAQATAGADVRVLPKLVREVAHVLGRIAFRVRVVVAAVIAVVLTILSVPLALAVAVALAGGRRLGPDRTAARHRRRAGGDRGRDRAAGAARGSTRRSRS